MSVTSFNELIKQAKYGKTDKEWFPRWIRRYAETVESEKGRLLVTRGAVVAFSRQLLQRQTPAWQRLQAVRAIEAYRTIVLERSAPCLQDIRTTLGHLAAQEKGDNRSDKEIVGFLAPSGGGTRLIHCFS